MTTNTNTFRFSVYTVAALCALGVILQIFTSAGKVPDKPDTVTQIRNKDEAGNSPTASQSTQRLSESKAITKKVDYLLARARQAATDRHYDRVVDLYYDAVLLESALVAKWNKDRYIGEELEIIKKLRRDYYLPKRRSGTAQGKLMKIDFILSKLMQGCKN